MNTIHTLATSPMADLHPAAQVAGIVIAGLLLALALLRLT
jgi:hypothetical protein